MLIRLETVLLKLKYLLKFHSNYWCLNSCNLLRSPLAEIKLVVDTIIYLFMYLLLICCDLGRIWILKTTSIHVEFFFFCQIIIGLDFELIILVLQANVINFKNVIILLHWLCTDWKQNTIKHTHHKSSSMSTLYFLSCSHRRSVH